MRTGRSKAASAGFTLLEMLIVIAIILTLMALLVVLIKGVMEKARNTKTWATVKMLDEACHTYKVDYQRFPPNDKGPKSKSLHYYLGRDRSVPAVFTATGTGPMIKRPPLIEFQLDMLMYPGTGLPDPNNPVDVSDAWGKAMYYTNPGTNNKTAVDIWSEGKDTTDPGDDIANWTDAVHIKDY